jgi:hypothetical protein
MHSLPRISLVWKSDSRSPQPSRAQLSALLAAERIVRQEEITAEIIELAAGGDGDT